MADRWRYLSDGLDASFDTCTFLRVVYLATLCEQYDDVKKIKHQEAGKKIAYWGASEFVPSEVIILLK
jgi:hypothetical protein